TEGPDALVVGRGHAVVADVGVREGDDLAGVRGVGDDLLVAREHGVEHDLAGGDRRRCADGLALEGGAVGEDEQGFGDLAHRCTSPSMTTGSPNTIVWRTRPVSARPAYGVLRLRLALAA